MTTVKFASDTTCNSCESIIVRQMKKVNGVSRAEYDYVKEAGSVTFDESVASIDEIFASAAEKGYICRPLGKGKNYGWLIAVLGIAVVAYFLFGMVEGISMPQISQNMGYGLLFIVGLLTGFHCVAMCGGFVVGYTAKNSQEGKSSHRSHLFYGTGKVISYTIIGAVFGLLGSVIAFTPAMRGYAGIAAGIFLVLFGLRMLFPILRKFYIRTPKFASRLLRKESSPFVIGLLNGLMIACGPLQAIYIMAAGTGSWLEGAKTLFVFALGTLPVMLGFGYFTSFVSAKLTRGLLKASGAVVVVLGLIMLNNGLVLTGTGYDLTSVTARAVDEPAPLAQAVQGYQEIHMDVTRAGWSPNTFVLQKDVPVRWIIDGKEITGCNNAIQVPAYSLQFDIKPGEQVIEFTPEETGTVRWSCWMGMIPGSFIIKENIEEGAETEIVNPTLQPSPSGGSCGCGCGG